MQKVARKFPLVLNRLSSALFTVPVTAHRIPRLIIRIFLEPSLHGYAFTLPVVAALLSSTVMGALALRIVTGAIGRAR